MRKTPVVPAMLALHKAAWGEKFRACLAEAGKPPKLIIGAMMRKLAHVAYGVLTGRPFDPALHST